LDNRAGEMSSDSASNSDEMAFGTQTIKSEAEAFIKQNLSKELALHDDDHGEEPFINIKNFIGPRQVESNSGQLNLKGEAE
jgi:hypothetical protein